ncbi:hypothetical protein [Yersinia aldovae]|uniref:hypothetical protein n=1 Tax=Yersinia aldovae TaxID=29483 RepID=UPI0005ACD9E8|nr:hypothetical protein [Yersinia aldovae]AJJ61681.1 putative membrane protein [Yersinia aldovae 670-83]CNH49702.1 Uncharacterised protein [Yersinia aldovae]
MDIMTLLKALIGGAGAGFALSGGLSLLIPALTVTTSFAFTFAALGGIVTAGVYLKNSRVV